jgi:predicted DNA binding CopG/RHH family protein
MKKLKQLPILTSDEEAEDFVANSDLTEYDLSGFQRVHFELQPKTERVNMRLPKSLLDAARAKAAAEGIPYQRLIRRALERELAPKAAE